MTDLKQIPTGFEMRQLAATIVHRFTVTTHGVKPHTLVVAESLTSTGGMLSSMLASVPGASKIYRGGVTVCATDLKASILDVDQERLEFYGTVDSVVAVQMALSVSALCKANWGISTTGVGGLDPQEEQSCGKTYVGGLGPQDEQPFGRTYVAVTFDKVQRWVQEFTLMGDREVIRLKATMCALMLLERCTRCLS